MKFNSEHEFLHRKSEIEKMMTQSYPYGVAVDGAGNLYIADTSNNRIRKVTPGGTITTVAGNGTPGYNGDNIAATSAELNQPSGVAVDGAGNLYIADLINNRIRKVTPAGTITTVAGNGTPGYNGDNIAATGAKLNVPSGVVVDGVGNLYIADYLNNRIRKVTPGGTITTVAGDGYNAGGAGGIGGGYSGDGGPATSAELNVPYGVAVDGVGNLYIADTLNQLIRKVTPDGTITTVAGGGNGCPGETDSIGIGDGCIATSAVLGNTEGVAVDGAGNLYIAAGGRIRKVSGTTAPVSFPTIPIGPPLPPNNVLLAINSSLTISSVSVPQSQGGVQEFTVGTIAGCAADGVTTNVAGSICTVQVTFQPGYPGLRQVPLVVQTSAGLFQFALQGTGIGPMVAFGPGTITTVAGNGSCAVQDANGNCYNGDNIVATGAELFRPGGVAVDGAGNLYIADVKNNRIRTVTPGAGGIITTVAGNGTPGYNNDNIAATSAELNWPASVAVDGAGNLYIADTMNSRIRKVTPDGTITTVAGNGTPGYDSDNIAATSAELNQPSGVAVDGDGNLYIADMSNSRIRKVTPGGIITTVAGNGTPDYSGDGGAATSAELNLPTGVAVDSAGNLYIADMSNSRIRKVTPGGTITTVAGNGIAGYNNDNIAATGANLNAPSGVAVDGVGNLYIADIRNNRIRKVDVSDAPSLTFADTNINAASAPQDVAVLNLGNAPLAISQISTPSDFSLQGPDTTCSSSGQTLNPAASCVLGIEFNPTASGGFSEGVTLTDNHLPSFGYRNLRRPTDRLDRDLYRLFRLRGELFAVFRSGIVERQHTDHHRNRIGNGSGHPGGRCRNLPCGYTGQRDLHGQPGHAHGNFHGGSGQRAVQIHVHRIHYH
jgi:sugar lactone lactonase YvrE